MSKQSKPTSHKPASLEDVYKTMVSYCSTKQFSVPDTTLKTWAELCFLFYEGRGWRSVTYWPAVVMKWVLTNVDKLPNKGIALTKEKPVAKGNTPKGETIRERILREQDYEADKS